METRLWNWLSKGFDGLVAIFEQVSVGQDKMPEDCLEALIRLHERMTNVINSQLEKRSRAPLDRVITPAGKQ